MQKRSAFLFPRETSIFFTVFREFEFFRSYYVGASKFCRDSSGPSHNIGLSGKSGKLLCDSWHPMLSLWLFFGFSGNASPEMPVKQVFLTRTFCDLVCFSPKAVLPERTFRSFFAAATSKIVRFRDANWFHEKRIFSNYKIAEATVNVVFPDLALKHDFGAGGLQDDIVGMIRPGGAR